MLLRNEDVHDMFSNLLEVGPDVRNGDTHGLLQSTILHTLLNLRNWNINDLFNDALCNALLQFVQLHLNDLSTLRNGHTTICSSTRRRGCAVHLHAAPVLAHASSDLRIGVRENACAERGEVDDVVLKLVTHTEH